MKFTSGGMNSVAEFLQWVIGESKWGKGDGVKVSQKDIDNTPDEDPAFYQGLLGYEVSSTCGLAHRENIEYTLYFKSPKGMETEFSTMVNTTKGWNFYHENGFEIK